MMNINKIILSVLLACATTSGVSAMEGGPISSRLRSRSQVFAQNQPQQNQDPASTSSEESDYNNTQSFESEEIDSESDQAPAPVPQDLKARLMINVAIALGAGIAIAIPGYPALVGMYHTLGLCQDPMDCPENWAERARSAAFTLVATLSSGYVIVKCGGYLYTFSAGTYRQLKAVLAHYFQ